MEIIILLLVIFFIILNNISSFSATTIPPVDKSAYIYFKMNPKVNNFVYGTVSGADPLSVTNYDGKEYLNFKPCIWFIDVYSCITFIDINGRALGPLGADNARIRIVKNSGNLNFIYYPGYYLSDSMSFMAYNTFVSVPNKYRNNYRMCGYSNATIRDFSIPLKNLKLDGSKYLFDFSTGKIALLPKTYIWTATTPDDQKCT
jgi:hypothetical protein